MSTPRTILMFRVKRYLQEHGVATTGKDKRLCYTFVGMENLTIPDSVSVFTYLESLLDDPVYRVLADESKYAKGNLVSQKTV